MSNNCPTCGCEEAQVTADALKNGCTVVCPVCGAYFVSDEAIFEMKCNEVASWLYYHKKYAEDNKGIKSFYDITVNDFKKTNPNNITLGEISNWYPKTFSDKVDSFLLYLHKKTKYMGQMFLIQPDEQSVAFFSIVKANSNDLAVRNSHNNFFITYLREQKLIDNKEDYTEFCLAPNGYKRVDELQKKISEDTKNVFVAMSFAEEMDDVRTAIKNAIIKCGYIPRIMDEIEHNHQIVPEMLYEIRQSKFLIAELTGHNNGAYFEEGYALGYGKEVIQLCNNSAFGEDGHFDVKQVNTVLWDKPDDLEDKLEKRIKATID